MIPGLLRYDRTSLVLHWIVAVGILTMLAIGVTSAFLSPGPAKTATIQLHKSIGIIVGLAALARLAWRGGQGFAEDLPGHFAWQPRVARAVHVLLLLTTVMMPVTGILKSITFARGVDVFGVRLIPALLHEKHPDWHAAASFAHDAFAWLLAALLVLHVTGALSHVLGRRGASIHRPAS